MNFKPFCYATVFYKINCDFGNWPLCDITGFLCPRIERSGAYCFTVVRLSVRPSVRLSVCANLT